MGGAGDGYKWVWLAFMHYKEVVTRVPMVIVFEGDASPLEPLLEAK